MPIKNSASFTIIADSNIASLDDFFNPQTLSQNPTQTITIIRAIGRDINAQLLHDLQPDVLLIRSVTPVNESLLANNTSVKFVGSATIGTDHVDQAYLAARNITFANAAGCSKHSVAQYVLTAILTLRPQYWQQPLTLGIIGLGNIGSTLAKYAIDLGWQVLGYDPLLPPSNYNNATFEQVLTQSNAISLHVPLTSRDQGADYPTQHLIDASALAMMSSDSLLINSARGPVIAADDLEKDIKSTQRQVVLDVFEHEPQIAAELLTQLTIATPHIAGYTLEGKLRGTQMIYDALCEQFDVEPVQSMHQLLPVNMYLWSELKARPDRLAKFYDIMADDRSLRAQLRDGQVAGADFDQLRRDYHLRREWQS
ncbi:MAG: 4-phosphoerythronate dehydrogenase [Psychrobacter sp.]|nr:4-phosphoerythronate dehydrogenase [Psychrobacter sp.]